MEKGKYRVVFSGEILPGFDIEEVKQKLRKLFKADAEKIERFFSGNKHIIIKDSDREFCKKIFFAGDKCGAVFKIEEQQGDSHETTGDLLQIDRGEPVEEPDDVTADLMMFPLFEGIPAKDLQILKPFVDESEYDENTIILRKNDIIETLFLVVSGIVEVRMGDAENSIFISSGGIFGERKAFSGEMSDSTVMTVSETRMLSISGNDFRMISSRLPALQVNLTRYLARKMVEANEAENKGGESKISGDLAETTPAKLLQQLNIQRENGTLTLKTKKGAACITFKNGAVLNAKFMGMEGRKAFFEILKLEKGRCDFIPGLSRTEQQSVALGDFLELLTEGLRRIEEDNLNFLKTVLPVF